MTESPCPSRCLWSDLPFFTLNLCDSILVPPSVSLPEFLCFSFSYPSPSICRKQYDEMVINLDSEHRWLRPESQRACLTLIIQSTFVGFIHSLHRCGRGANAGQELWLCPVCLLLCLWKTFLPWVSIPPSVGTERSAFSCLCISLCL